MRTVAITVHNDQKLEVFVEKHKHHFEVWQVGTLKGRRVLLDHRLTHDDLEAHLEYSRPGDLVWRDAAHLEIPAEKHRNAVETEATIRAGTFWDYDDKRLDEMEAAARQVSGLPPSSGSHRSVASHLNAIAFLDTNRESMKAAGRTLLGRWTDGIATLTMKPNHKLEWSCTDPRHPLNVGEQVHKHAPDWWNFAMWRLALMNDQHKCGTHIGVLRVDNQELHVSCNHPHRIAHLFRRDKDAASGLEEAVASNEPFHSARTQAKRRPTAGKATPLLRGLEQALARRKPSLVERLKPGLPESDIRAALNKAKVAGAIEPLIQLYSWSNGTALDEKTPIEEMSFFPEDGYWFMDLEEAIETFEEISRAAETMWGMVQETEAHDMFSAFTGRLFPLFRDGGGGALAIDTTPSKRNPVVVVEFDSAEPIRQAYGSFEDFIKDAIRANRKACHLACFSHEEFE